MPRTSCPGLSAAQKSKLWTRWKNGESLGDIGRALGKHAASVFTFVIAKGGIAPAIRHRMTEELQELGVKVGRRSVGRLMRDNGIKIFRIPKYKFTTDSNHAFNIA